MSTEHGVPARGRDGIAANAGYLLVAPLVLALAGVGLLPDPAARELAQRAAIAWGAVLLGGVAGLNVALVRATATAWTLARTAGAVAPPLAAAAAATLGGQRGLALLVVAWGGSWLYERRAGDGILPAAVLDARRQLTLVVGVLLALTLVASDAAGLA